MNKHLGKLATFVSLLASSSVSWAGQVVVTLSPEQQVVNSGEVPRFVVEAKAVGTSLRIIKFAVRRDLLDNYARIRVTRNGKQVAVPVAISDPGPTKDSDYQLLQPNQRVSFEHRGTPFALDRLPPGEYSATVTLQPDWRDTPVTSNSVSFKVLPK